MGILRPDDQLVITNVKNLYYVYMYFDRHCIKVVQAILAEREHRGMYSIGRYGRWKHTSMKDAMGKGKQLAERLCVEGNKAISA